MKQLRHRNSRPAELLRDVVRSLTSGHVVLWVRGGSEFGPRALGNRSLLAVPRDPKMQDYINRQIKNREDFRPFAPIVPRTVASDYFEGMLDSPYMVIVAASKEVTKKLAPAVVHVDGSARLQTVEQSQDGLLHALLLAVGQATGAPILLNTSANVRGMPIAETPEDAIGLFLGTPIDLMVLGDHLVSKVD